jgi:diguanylate cyclase (GGDEF)-like protein
VVTLSAAMLASGLLLLIFRAAQRRLTRQTKELVESTRRDPLTGTLNHGALVSLLAGRIEAARAGGAPAGGSIGVALVDLDNFTLLNDHHGHAIGDVALAAVLDELRLTAPLDAVIGRYGPDEFLVIVEGEDIAALEPSILALRDRLVDRALEVDAPDRLPITVSAGIAAYPKDGSSLTVLLATVAATLGAAKASGGDDVKVAGAEDADATGTSSFDVLQGLVFAVDTKDRYTKRHSEDVARYAVFLARQLGLDDATVGSIRVAGLLHDIGKIGIPDLILRKPGKLTDEEYEIVKQHVVLGDMIVRDVPDIELVRAGIRGHHERWDGHGYVDRLAGEEIPLVARILSVGDAFSAMTTSRPYRRALDIREAIRRLEDAAGTQLDATLVTAFVHGIETVPDAPMPGRESTGTLWTPGAVA